MLISELMKCARLLRAFDRIAEVLPMDGLTERLDALEPGKALDALEREFPGWRTWMASGLCHALPRTGPALLVHGQDPVDLRDQIVRAEAFREAR